MTALRAPATRGRWGELQLKRVCEMAGMIEHCDFEQQSSADTDDGRVRPDLIVRLPGGMNVVVDAKVPLEAYLNAFEADDDDKRRTHLETYGRQCATTCASWARRRTRRQLLPDAGIRRLFLPSEAFHSAALEQVPGLIRRASTTGPDRHPDLADRPAQGGAYGWRQERMAESASRSPNSAASSTSASRRWPTT